MADQEKKVKKIIDDEEKALVSITNEIFDGVKIGIKSGIRSGLRRGITEGLADCITGDIADTGRDGLVDLCNNIRGEVIKETIKQGSKPLFDRPAKEFVDKICPKLGDHFIEDNKDIDEVGLDVIRTVAMRKEKELFGNMSTKLPVNPLFKPIIDGIDSALKDTMEKRLKECEQVILAKIENRKGH